MHKLVESILQARMGFRRKILYLNRLVWAQKKVVRRKEKDILRKYCGIKTEEPIADSETGQINLKYNPKDINKDYYL